MIRNLAVNVTTTPVALTIGDVDINDGMTVWIHNHDHGTGHSLYIGDETVSASTGYHLPSTSSVGPIGLAKGEVVYAVSDQAGGVPLRVFATRT
jgi:hypothetical protein